MRLFEHVCARMYMYARASACVHACERMYMCVCVCLCMHACLYACIFVSVQHW